MTGLTRCNHFENLLDFHNNFDQLFNQLWKDLPTRTPAVPNTPVQLHVRATDDAWKVSIPMPGIDPKYVTLDASGNTLSIRAEQPEENDTPSARFEQAITVPNIVDLEKVKASYRFGMLDLTLPWKDSVKPRRIQIDTTNSASEQKQIHAVAS
jgi:HSP20 family protein